MAQKNQPRAGAGAARNGGGRSSAARTETHRQPAAGSSTPRRETVAQDDTGRDSWLGTDRGHRTSNVSWGAIFAGLVTFLAVLVLLGVLASALGLAGVGGTAVGIWSLVALVLGLAAAGFVAGALAVRGGLLHGLVTWATSLVGLLLTVGLLGSSLVGTVGGALGGAVNSAAQATSITAQDAEAAGAQVDQQDVDQAQAQAGQAAEDAQRTLEENRDELTSGAWWTFGGLLLGAVVASLAGVAGARAVHRRETEIRNGVGRRVDA